MAVRRSSLSQKILSLLTDGKKVGPPCTPLTKLIREKLGIVTTPVPSERIFSKMGQITSEQGNRIEPSKMRELVFLKANLLGANLPGA